MTAGQSRVGLSGKKLPFPPAWKINFPSSTGAAAAARVSFRKNCRIYNISYKEIYTIGKKLKLFLIFPPGF